MTWTDERVNTLRELWGNGKSASEIAKILGGGISRNAVIGKAHRLNLSGRPSPIKRKPTSVAERPRPAPVMAPKPKVVAPEPETTAPAGGATILSLTERMCRWPIGDPRTPQFRFCGCAVAPGETYCSKHAAVAYQKPNTGRRDSVADMIPRARTGK